jgi:LPXTG-motif cell wall-anchored protein
MRVSQHCRPRLSVSVDLVLSNSRAWSKEAKKLPKTANPLPFTALGGLTALLLGLGLFRRRPKKKCVNCRRKRTARGVCGSRSMRLDPNSSRRDAASACDKPDGALRTVANAASI